MLDDLLAELVDGCALWDDYRHYYIEKFIPELQAGQGNPTQKERALINQIRSVATPEQWASLSEIVDAYVTRRENDRVAAIEADKCAAAIAAKEFAAAREAERLQQEEARKRAETVGAERERRRVEFEEQQRREAEINARKKAEIEPILRSALRESVAKADDLDRKINAERLVDYATLKANYVGEWLSSRSGIDGTSREQVDAIGEMAPAFLLKARAGSGKTSVITAKASFLVEHESVSPDQLMILAFNRKAADEVRGRIKKQYGLIEFRNARTFHSLAYQLAQPKGRLLFDQTGGSTNLRKQSVFVQQLLNTVMNPAVLAEIYLFFREETKQLEEVGAFLSKEDYYVYRRNHVQETLGGQSVKSVGEKWLADFLFEHGIRYAYERLWFWGGQNYRPDFSLSIGDRPDIVIEHWGIDPEDRIRLASDHWTMSWGEYREQIDRKRAYWLNYNEANPTQPVLFLETSVADLRGGREAFEDRLRCLLSGAGVNVERRSVPELQKAVVVHRIGRFSAMCLQYIQRAKKKRISPEGMEQRIRDAKGVGSKAAAFLHIANSLYRRYQRALVDENKIDFDDLIAAAIDRVHETKGQCQVRILNDRSIAMNELRWIMIDEYQDFSLLFNDLVAAIRTYNYHVNLFCVGDDWQAINAFAGSDLRFFDGFSSLLEGATTGHLKNNYRSEKQLVELCNRFMQGKGEASTATIETNNGHIELCHTDKIWIEQRPGEEYAEERTRDERFKTPVAHDGLQKDSNLRVARILKQCHTIVTSPRYSPDTTFAILSRVEQLGAGYDLAAFHSKLKSTLLPDELGAFGDFDARVRCGTVHSFKGLEAHVAIVLGVNERNFPKIHSDNELYGVFGATPSDVLAEEERLFYVALTRTKTDLFLLTETGRESEFLDRLGLLRGKSAVRGSCSASAANDDIPF